MPSSGCVSGRHPQRAADGVLRACPVGARRQDPRRRDPADRCEQIRVGLLAGGSRRKVSRRAARPAYDPRPPGKRRQLSCRGARARPFQSIPELARRSGLGTGALVRLAKADAFASLGLSRREASWAIKGLRDEALPLFEAAEQRAQEIVPEQIEEEVSLPAMTRRARGRRRLPLAWPVAAPHPLAFLRSELTVREISPCGALRDSERRFAHYRLGPCDGAAAARLRQGRYVYHS